MRDLTNSNPYLFSSAKPDINKTKAFINKLDFNKVMENSRNQVSFELENPQTQEKLSPYLRPNANLRQIFKA